MDKRDGHKQCGPNPREFLTALGLGFAAAAFIRRAQSRRQEGRK